jgi:uncharacterized protein YkwD
MKNLWLLPLTLGLAGCYFEYISDHLVITYGQCLSPGELQGGLIVAINLSRGQGRYCGNTYYPAVQPVAWNSQLAQAAQNHADDMARYDYLNSLGPDGSSLAQRLQQSGYPASVAGENLSGGQREARQTVDAWLANPAQCANLMSPLFREIGGACAGREGTQYDTYWSLVLAAPL